MEEAINNDIKEIKKESSISIQDYLSIGYVILLILGVFHETIYYNSIGINILEYSSLLDVLISPIAVISGNLVLGLALVLCGLLAFAYAKLLPKYYKWLGKKKKYQTGKNKAKLDKISKQIEAKSFTLAMTILFVFSMFIGLGIGRGVKAERQINEEEIKLTHELFFEDGTHQNIKMLGKNSLYVFYITKQKEEVSIAPIDGNIKIIKKLKKVDSL